MWKFPKLTTPVKRLLLTIFCGLLVLQAAFPVEAGRLLLAFNKSDVTASGYLANEPYNYYTDDSAADPLLFRGGWHQTAFAANRGMLPANTSSSSNYVRHSLIKFTVPNNANYSRIRLTYTNWGINSAFEFNGSDNFNLKSAIEYGGTTYAVTFNGGATSVGVPPGATVESDPIPNLNFTPGSTGYVMTRTVGRSGSVSRIIGHGTHVIANEGGVVGTSEAVDLTNGVYGKGATAGNVTISGGNITAIAVATAGSNYSGGTSVYAYELQSDGTIAQKTVGNTNLSGGTVASISITSGTPPSGVAAWVNPTIVIGNQFASTTQVYGPAFITGIPDTNVKSLLIAGDSIAIGFGSTDNIGDLARNYGIYERGLANKAGEMNISTTGGTAAGYASSTLYYKTHQLFVGLPTHVLVAIGSNDVVGGATKSTVQTNIGTIATRYRNGGASVSFAKILPRTTSTDSWATVGNQTGATGFTLGGVADLINADYASGTTTSDFTIIDARTFFQDSTSTFAWDVANDNTDDGIHPTLLGMARVANDNTFLQQFSTLQ